MTLLKTDEINRKRRERYAKDAKYQRRVLEDNKKYLEHHPDIVPAQSAQRFKNDTCRILTDHSNEHKDDDDRLTTDFIADQLKKFKGKIYDDGDLELLEKMYKL